MTTIIDELRQQWQDRLSQTEDSLTDRQRDTIINWLLGEDSQRWDNLDERDLEIAKRGLVYLWQILRQRYLKVSPTSPAKNSHLGFLKSRSSASGGRCLARNYSRDVK
jgi:hypothetical protein